jgi:hypothetical protein
MGKATYHRPRDKPTHQARSRSRGRADTHLVVVRQLGGG